MRCLRTACKASSSPPRRAITMGAMTWRKTGVYVLLALPVLGLAGIAVAAKHQDASQQTGDPIADAARKAREQKKNAAQPKKVFTNDDVAPAPAPAPRRNRQGRPDPRGPLPGPRDRRLLRVAPASAHRGARVSRDRVLAARSRGPGAPISATLCGGPGASAHRSNI